MTQTAKHTPGPWKQKGVTTANNGHVFCGDVHIADCINCNKLPPKEAEANAKLIAAAPDMVEALKRISSINHNLGTLTDTHMLGKCIEIAAAVLAKVGAE